MTLQLALVTERLAARGITLEVSDDARTLLGNLGYDPIYGARPLKRVVQKQLVDRLALGLLDGSFREGETVVADARDGCVLVCLRVVGQQLVRDEAAVGAPGDDVGERSAPVNPEFPASGHLGKRS